MKSWQDVMNKVAAQKEMQAFQFNTYVISVLVIFFLQQKQKFPKCANVQATQYLAIDRVPHENIEQLKWLVTDFFGFYDSDKLIYQKINVHTGQWEKGAKKRFVEITHPLRYIYNLFLYVYGTLLHSYFPF